MFPQTLSPVESSPRFHAIRTVAILLAWLAPALCVVAPVAAQQPADSAAAEEKSDEGLAGTWQGALRVGPVELRLVFQFEQDDAGKLGGTLTSIDQTPNPIPLSAVQLADGQVTAAVAAIGGEFSGKLNKDKSAIEGKWKQSGSEFDLIVKRVAEAPAMKRPQEPKPPFPYDVEEVAFENSAAQITLAGTFTKPKGPGPHPAVVMITGSGPQDRDETVMGHKPFAVIADDLTRHGIAVLRFDDRGVGKSTGDFSAATHNDFVGDALAAVDWLKGRPEINARQIGLIGHSEGGVVAPLAAVQRPDDVAFIVMLAGVGVPMRELLAQQGQDIGRTMGLSEASLARDADVEGEFYDALRNDENLPTDELKQKLTDLIQGSLDELSDEERDKLGVTPEVIKARVDAAVTPWFRELAMYDPGPTLEKVRCPVLALNGALDVQVAADANLNAISTAIKRGGNHDVTTLKLPGLNHLFQECETGSIAEYSRIEQTFAPAALDAVSAWILERVDAQSAP